MLVEKFVEEPRHVEIQILGDKHGNVIHLNERECSIQRRNQKVIEEAPSPYLDEETREAMGSEAVSLAKSIGYDSAGTVEFLIDSKKNFYFLEMNTRLQVEHPITECITGVDLVHQMIRSAYGYKLNLTQKDVSINGWAIESRVYAEDPFRNFGTPSVGRLYRYQEPAGVNGVRCDSGIEEGSEITLYYDAMICKLTAYGRCRNESISTSINALDHYVIRGVTHNIPLLRDILTEEKFRSGAFTTNYLNETYPNGFEPFGGKLSARDTNYLAGIAAIIYCKEQQRAREVNINYPMIQQRSRVVKHVNLIVDVMGKNLRVDIRVNETDFFVETLPSEEAVLDGIDKSTMSVKNDFTLSNMVIVPKIKDSHGEHESCNFQLISKLPNGILRLRYKGTAVNIPVLPAKAAKLKQYMKKKPSIDTSKQILSPMPGLVKSINLEIGQAVHEGMECCIIEAMKMQNVFKATKSGIIKEIKVSEGDISIC
jgi:propionyl-CoA carboxylase alpha chain